MHPAVKNLHISRELPGFSGAQIFVASHDGKTWFVRKAAGAPATSLRVRAQAEKQRAWALQRDQVFRTPSILDDGEVDGLYWFDMELVRGVDAATHLREASFPEVRQFAEQMCAHLRWSSGAPPLRQGGSNAFMALQERVLRARQISSSSLIASSSFDLILQKLNILQTRGAVPPTLCHGDLTLENMLVDESGKIYVVDLLDSPFEHWWLDIAKTHQDLAAGWYLRRQSAIAPSVTQYVSARMLQTAGEIDAGYAQIHVLLIACTLLRVFPYAQNDTDRRFLAERIDHFSSHL